jgi:hypothetical protein
MKLADAQRHAQHVDNRDEVEPVGSLANGARRRCPVLASFDRCDVCTCCRHGQQHDTVSRSLSVCVEGRSQSTATFLQGRSEFQSNTTETSRMSSDSIDWQRSLFDREQTRSRSSARRVVSSVQRLSLMLSRCVVTCRVVFVRQLASRSLSTEGRRNRRNRSRRRAA